MLLEKYGKWKSLFEDDTQCFSKAIDLETENEVLIISYYSIDSLAKSTRLIIPDSLYNYIEHIEDEHGFHIVLKIVDGMSLKKFIKMQNANYQSRVQLCYSWLKSIHKYEQFPDSVKIQLLDYEQLVVVNNQIVAREWIDYSSKEEISWLDVFKQIGETLDIILHDSKDHQSQWIENLILGNHSLFTFALLRKHFKSVFVYEKPEAINDISFEYNIVLNDASASYKIDPSTVAHVKMPLNLSENPVPRINEKVENKVDDEVEALPEATYEPERAETVDTFFNDSHTNDQAHDLPEVLPRNKAPRRQMELEDDHDVQTWFDSTDSLDESPTVPRIFNYKNIALFAIPIVIALLILLYLFFGKNEPIVAKFAIEPLMENRVAFMNKSSGGDDVESYLWEIYFKDQLVHSFTDENLFPIFETEGTYTIHLKIQDKKGHWTEAYTMKYEFKKN